MKHLSIPPNGILSTLNLHHPSIIVRGPISLKIILSSCFRFLMLSNLVIINKDILKLNKRLLITRILKRMMKVLIKNINLFALYNPQVWRNLSHSWEPSYRLKNNLVVLILTFVYHIWSKHYRFHGY